MEDIFKISEIFGKVLRDLDMESYERRIFNVDSYLKLRRIEK